MALINCKECGKEISSNALSCPHCGSSIVKKMAEAWFKAYFGSWAVIIGFIAVLAFIGAIINSTKPLEKTATKVEVKSSYSGRDRNKKKKFVAVDNFFAKDYGEDWPFTVDAISVKCKRKNRGDTWSIAAVVEGRSYALNSNANIWFNDPYPDYIMKPEFIKKIKDGFQVEKPLGNVAARNFMRTQIGQDIEEFCGDWR